MPNQSSHFSAHGLGSTPASSAVMDRPYGRRDLRPVSPNVRTRSQKPMGPDAIWGQFNNYRSNGLVGSAVAHVIVLGLILSAGLFGHEVVQKAQEREVVTLIAPSPDSYALPVATKVVSGGGGGGDHDIVAPTKGRLPKTALQQFTPPQIVIHNPHPKLAVEPTVVVPPQVHMADNHMLNLGAPTVAAMPSAPPSNGTGSGGGIGTGAGGGVGVGHGPGVGAGSGGGIGGGVYKVGGGISAPTPVNTPDPEYTEEARNAKAQGTCILWLIVDDQGNPRDIRVVRGLGYGLDAKAISAVKQWKFQPAMKDGHAVNVQISVEVGFRLY